MIKNIIFDVGNVIWKGNSKSIINYIKIDNIEDKEKISSFFQGFRSLDLAEETIEEHYEKWKENNNLNDDYDNKYKNQLINYYRNREFNSEVINLINKLKENNYKIFVLSNNNEQAINYLKSCEETKNIDGWVVSYEYKLVKPDKEFYKILLNKYNLKPEECFFVDDKEKNVQAGIELGMSGHVLDYENNKADLLINDLRVKGVKI
ncbi:MAG: HAD-IA family hydrolase [Clostridia bacterium]|nr:HAD-IA family hydrolase [Clostridia bacterium]